MTNNVCVYFYPSCLLASSRSVSCAYSCLSHVDVLARGPGSFVDSAGPSSNGFSNTLPKVTARLLAPQHERSPPHLTGAADAARLRVLFRSAYRSHGLLSRKPVGSSGLRIVRFSFSSSRNASALPCGRPRACPGPSASYFFFFFFYCCCCCFCCCRCCCCCCSGRLAPRRGRVRQACRLPRRWKKPSRCLFFVT